MRFPSLLFALILTGWMALGLPVWAEDLIEIGSAEIDVSKAGSVTIDVSTAKGGFRSVRIRNAGENAIDVSQVRVVYDDQSFHLEERQINMRGGERSRAIDPAKKDRFINSVVVTWNASSGATTVKVLGDQSRAGRRMERAAAPAVANNPAPSPSGSSAIKKGEKLTEDGILFGHKLVPLAREQETIEVGREIGKFDRIRLRVLGSPIFVDKAKITYADGTRQDVTIVDELKADTQTSWIEIDGNKFIATIELTYRPKLDSKNHSRIEITGEYAKTWLGASGEGVKFNEGWVLLGAQTAGFTGYDRDLIPVSPNEGGFARLRVVAKDRAITLREIRVVFQSGPDEVFQMRERVEPGKPYGPLEFKVGRAAIKEIRARYRSRFDLSKGLTNLFEGTPAVVEIWGQH
ncbi:MAG: DUF2541 domain-containing protein [Hyphomicrobium sp.]|nr:DUF2541 domain-containing protein [Hyphomicrobium sp.]